MTNTLKILYVCIVHAKICHKVIVITVTLLATIGHLVTW